MEVKRENGLWKLLLPTSYLLSDKVVIATGFENKLFNMDYMGVHGVWGNRGDFSSSLDLLLSMHQSMSVSANVEGIIKLGATHERSVQDVQPCEEAQVLRLKEMASTLIDTSDLALIQMYCGMRAGSRDSFPLIGKVIDVDAMLEHHPSIKKGRKFPLKYVDNLYVYNGLGGRGFVFAPMLAQMLAEHIVEKKEIDSRVNPDRLFWKWCRKL
jgi:tRNA 5-methylaminomethyl-2-thiouridine biosynthesis bifunctional protein